MFGWIRKKPPAAPAASSATVHGRVDGPLVPPAVPPVVPPLVLPLRPPLGQPLATTPGAPPQPALAAEQFRLGEVHRLGGRLAEAEQHYRLAVAAQPDHADALINLGALLRDRRQLDEAASVLESALKARPKSAAAAFNLGMVRVDQRNWPKAAGALQTAVELDPKNHDAQYWLGNASMGIGLAGAARRAYLAAIKSKPDFVQARWGLAMAQLPAVAASDAEQSSASESFRREVAKLRTWFKTNPNAEGFRAVGAQQPFYIGYIPKNHRAALSEYGALATSLMAAWARRIGVPKPAPASTGPKLRVAIVSAHVHSHSVWHALLRGWVEHLDTARFELHLFHTGTARDAETEWASKRVTKLHYGLGEWTAWAKAISDSRFDIVIYPELGMDSTTVRLAALRLARVQLASWGHPLTSGMPTIDGYISAEAFEPENAIGHYTEKLIALPRLGACYSPFRAAPVAPNLAALGLASGERMLLCAGTPFKYAPRDDALLIDIAKRCAPCKLVFFRAEPQALTALLEQRLRRSFDAAGSNFDEFVRFIPWQSQPAFFGLLDHADVYLDSIGFSGFNTTMQAIERGTPVVAWQGEFMRGRFASAILGQLGLEEWIADTAEGYAERVARLCADPALRRQVRKQIEASRHKLFDDRATVATLAEQLVALGRPQPA